MDGLKMIVYNDYTPEGNIIIKITEDEAIRQSKEYAAKYGYIYRNDREALDNFIVINWAWKE